MIETRSEREVILAMQKWSLRETEGSQRKHFFFSSFKLFLKAAPEWDKSLEYQYADKLLTNAEQICQQFYLHMLYMKESKII